MTWVRLADDFSDHPKIMAVGPLAGWLWVCGLAYANHYLTDGYLPGGVIRRLADVDDAPALAAKLVAARLWEPCDGGYRIHDYDSYQPSAEQVKVERAVNARRQDLFRNPELTRAVRERDGDACRYCGITVIWRDRRGPAGGTYDHVDPTGPNTLENLVVCCRGCNSAKGSRTPAAAGMVLRPVPSRFSVETSQVRADPGRNGSSSVLSESGLPGPGPGPGPGRFIPDPAVMAPTPQPPSPQAGPGARPRRRRRSSVDVQEPPAEREVLTPLTDGDRELWARALARAVDDMTPGNAAAMQFELIGRGADGGLRLRAPPGQLAGRFGSVLAAALFWAGDQAAEHVAIVEG